MARADAWEMQSETMMRDDRRTVEKDRALGVDFDEDIFAWKREEDATAMVSIAQLQVPGI